MLWCWYVRSKGEQESIFFYCVLFYYVLLCLCVYNVYDCVCSQLIIIVCVCIMCIIMCTRVHSADYNQLREECRDHCDAAGAKSFLWTTENFNITTNRKICFCKVTDVFKNIATGETSPVITSLTIMTIITR